MSTETIVPVEVIGELQEAADMAAKRIRDPDAVRQACERMDRVREEIFARQGMLDIGLAAIRELRDS